MLNFDDDKARRGVELCYRTRKTLVNPIIDWTDDEVWEFLNDIVKVKHCSLYDEGFKRLGCIGCPMSGPEKMKKEFEKYPAYKRAYLRSFEKMLEARKINKCDEWKKADDVFNWWIKESK